MEGWPVEQTECLRVELQQRKEEYQRSAVRKYMKRSTYLTLKSQRKQNSPIRDVSRARPGIVPPGGSRRLITPVERRCTGI